MEKAHSKKEVFVMGKKIGFLFLVLLSVLLITGPTFTAHAIPTQTFVTGEIQRITINNPADHWSGGTIVVGGETVIIPKNLLIDLPANRLTLKQLYDQAPAACAGQTGLAKADACNTTGVGGFATISANRTNAGNVIAGDVFIEKGKELVVGIVTYINYTEGYFRLNGTAAAPGGNVDPGTGVMVRLNDPTGRHTVQSGLGCTAGSLVNCSPDPRFTLDPDNYTNVFSSGYPLCIPKTADGLNDPFCPRTNRAAVFVPLAAEPPVPDSTKFAPIVLGDTITAEGNFETVNGVQFLSSHTTEVGKALTTQAGQPDYLFLAEVEIDAPGFQNQRARTLFIGFATQASPLIGADILIWSIHRDPGANATHEFPLASVRGCDNAAGVGECGVQGLGGAGNNIFKIRHDVDFGVATDAKLDPCAHLRAEPRFNAPGICPGGTSTNIAEQFAILSPIPHEIMARTGQKLATPGLAVVDVQGNPATWGEYLFPLGMNLGGVSIPEMNEIDLNLLATPFIFEGIPWNLDRRLSPGGCNGPCEGTPQPLDPFPFSGLDPRTQANVPAVAYNDPVYTASILSSARDRMLSFVAPGIGKFNGNATVLPLTLAVDPAAQPIPVLAPVVLVCTQGTAGAPVAVDDNTTTAGLPVIITVTANDTATLPAVIDPATVLLGRGASNGAAVVNADGTINYTPNAGFVGVDTFTYTVKDTNVPPGQSNPATVFVTVTPVIGNTPPVAGNDSAITAGVLVNINVIANDTDADGTIDPASVVIQQNAFNGTTAVNVTGTVDYTPNPGFVGSDSFTYTVKDNAAGESNIATVVVTVAATGNIPPLALDDTATTASVLVTIPVAANDSDPDGTVDPTSVAIQRTPFAGTAVAVGDGTVNYTPITGFVGVDSFTYTVRDNLGSGSNVATVTVNVNPPPNVAPVAANDGPFSTTPGTAIQINALANDTDADGALVPSSLAIVAGSTLPAGSGTAVVNAATGVVTFAPAVGFAGVTTFRYTVADNLGAVSNQATVTVTVNATGVAEVLTVTRADFRLPTGPYDLRGTSTVPGARITIHVGPTVTGPTIATVVADAAGNWRFTGTSTAPGTETTITVVSSGGASVTGFPLTIR
jgi:hypothetical protein